MILKLQPAKTYHIDLHINWHRNIQKTKNKIVKINIFWKAKTEKKFKNPFLPVNFLVLFRNKSSGTFLWPRQRAFIWYSFCNDSLLLTCVASTLWGTVFSLSNTPHKLRKLFVFFVQVIDYHVRYSNNFHKNVWTRFLENKVFYFLDIDIWIFFLIVFLVFRE